jgi:hypothetical protein
MKRINRAGNKSRRVLVEPCYHPLYAILRQAQDERRSWFGKVIRIGF